MKIKTRYLTDAALNWAVAKCEGRLLHEPVRATDADVANLAVPFTMYEVGWVWADDKVVRADVLPITVTRYGVNTAVGATAPSISFVGSDRREALGSVEMFYLDKIQAELEAVGALNGTLDDFHPSTDWSQGGPIIGRERILFRGVYGEVQAINAFFYATGSEGRNVTGPDHLIAAMRCYVASKLGDEVDVPDALISAQ